MRQLRSRIVQILYGSLLIPEVNSIDEDRDRLELYLLEEAVNVGKPFLGICRGLQLINIGLGGTIYEDITAQHNGAIKHDYFSPSWPRDYLAHVIQIVLTSTLSHILVTQELQVNSLHHQGIRQLAPGLQPVAYAPDGIVEAFEIPASPFGMGVQWHPENLQAHQPMRRLFSAFVAAAASNQ